MRYTQVVLTSLESGHNVLKTGFVHVGGLEGGGRQLWAVLGRIEGKPLRLFFFEGQNSSSPSWSLRCDAYNTFRVEKNLKEGGYPWFLAVERTGEKIVLGVASMAEAMDWKSRLLGVGIVNHLSAAPTPAPRPNMRRSVSQGDVRTGLSRDREGGITEESFASEDESLDQEEEEGGSDDDVDEFYIVPEGSMQVQQHHDQQQVPQMDDSRKAVGYLRAIASALERRGAEHELKEPLREFSRLVPKLSAKTRAEEGELSAVVDGVKNAMSGGGDRQAIRNLVVALIDKLERVSAAATVRTAPLKVESPSPNPLQLRATGVVKRDDGPEVRFYTTATHFLMLLAIVGKAGDKKHDITGDVQEFAAILEDDLEGSHSMEAVAAWTHKQPFPPFDEGVQLFNNWVSRVPIKDAASSWSKQVRGCQCPCPSQRAVSLFWRSALTSNMSSYRADTDESYWLNYFGDLTAKTAIWGLVSEPEVASLLQARQGLVAAVRAHFVSRVGSVGTALYEAAFHFLGLVSDLWTRKPAADATMRITDQAAVESLRATAISTVAAVSRPTAPAALAGPSSHRKKRREVLGRPRNFFALLRKSLNAAESWEGPSGLGMLVVVLLQRKFTQSSQLHSKFLSSHKQRLKGTKINPFMWQTIIKARAPLQCTRFLPYT